jgi:hypothetical protein
LPGGDGGEEESLARAVEHQHFGFGIDRAVEPKAPAEPGGGGLEKRIDAAVGGIAAKVGKMRGQYRADEGRDRMLRLADRQCDRRLAGLHIGQQIIEPRKGRACVGRPGPGQDGHV